MVESRKIAVSVSIKGELKIKAGGGPRSMRRWAVEHEEEVPGVPGVGLPEQQEEVHGVR